MLINFNELKEVEIPHMNNGNGSIFARMEVNECGRFVLCRIPSGSSIGLHKQDSNDDINYILQGEGKAICDGIEEPLSKGVCHVCPKGSQHTIINTGQEELIILTFVPSIK